ncbi:PD40 domain-containing protein [Candidatus Poribacteria bacterium]|nr:PD40 domain-containing protein [Candidatus Poribacteria bacterium]
MKTSFSFIFTIIIACVCCSPLTAQDNPQIGLPEGVVARIGKGALGEVHFSPDGSQLAISTSIGIWFHDPETGKALELLSRSHITRPYTFARPYAFAYSPDGKTIASTSWDKPERMRGRSIPAVEIWDVATGEDKAILIGHLWRVNSIAYSPDGETIATGGWERDNTVRLWNAQTGENIFTNKMQTKWGTFVIFAPDGTTYATVGDVNTVHLSDGKTGKHKIMLTGHTKRVSCAAYSPDSKTIATGSYDGTIRLWDVTTGTHKTTLSSDKESVTSIGYSPDGNTIVCGAGNGDVQLWDTRTMKLKSTFTGHTKRTKSVVYSPDGNIIATASSDGTVRLWDAATGQAKATLIGYMRINAAAYAPDSKTIVTGNQDGMVHFWDVSTGELKNTFTGDRGIIFDIKYSPDGKTIAVVSSYNDRVLLRDAKTGKHKATLEHFGLIDTIFLLLQNREYDINSIAYSPDGKTIVTGGDYYTVEKGTVYLWDARVGIRKRVIFKGPGAVYTVVFSKDGKRIIATGDWKNKVRVWDAETGRKLTPTPADMLSGSKGLLHSADGATTAHVHQNGTVRITKRETTLEKK